MRSSRLKPCHTCGVKPVIERWWSSGGPWYAVRCTNPDRPDSCSDAFYYSESRSSEEAIQKWNHYQDLSAAGERPSDFSTSDIAGSEHDLSTIINQPEMIVRTVRLTKPERAICSAVGASWISKSADEAWVRLWNKKPELEEDGLHYAKDVELLALVNVVFFPSISTGDCFYIGGDDQEGGEV